MLFWTLPCSLPCGTDNQDYENHLAVDCPGVGQIARGLRTIDALQARDTWGVWRGMASSTSLRRRVGW